MERALERQPINQGKPVIHKSTYMSETDDYDDELSGAAGCNSLATVAFALTVPFSMAGSCFVVQEKHHAVSLRCGKFETVETEPGCHFSNPCGRSITNISIARQTLELPKQKIVDHNGNPLLVSAIVTHYCINARRAALNVVNFSKFIKDQAEAVMKQVVSRYPYESTDGTPSLKNEVAEVGREMVELLQAKVNIAGAKIISFDLNEIAYAPEIAQGMLRRQQANALIAARKTIVHGAVTICADTVEQLAKAGIRLNESEQARVITNLLTVICADKDAGPCVPL